MSIYDNYARPEYPDSSETHVRLTLMRLAYRFGLVPLLCKSGMYVYICSASMYTMLYIYCMYIHYGWLRTPSCWQNETRFRFDSPWTIRKKNTCCQPIICATGVSGPTGWGCLNHASPTPHDRLRNFALMMAWVGGDTGERLVASDPMGSWTWNVQLGMVQG